MGLFDFLKNKKKTSNKQDSANPNPKDSPPTNNGTGVLVAMTMHNDGETINMQNIATELKNKWGCSVSDIDERVMKVNGEIVALMSIPAAIPYGDIQGTAQYAYNWPSAEKDLASHNSHTIVTVMSGESQKLKFELLTKVLASVLATTKAIGVYHGAQSLLIEKTHYISSAESLKNGNLPIDIWIFIGLRTTDSGNIGYTYGLSNFGKLEMEFIKSNLELQDIYNFLSNICSYIISNNITFKDGETLGYTADQKIKIKQSKGLFVDGQTLKMEM